MPDIAYGIRLTADSSGLKNGATDGAAALDKVGDASKRAGEGLRGLTAANDSHVKAQNAYLENLRKEVAELGLSKRATDELRQAKLNLTSAHQQEARALLDARDAKTQAIAAQNQLTAGSIALASTLTTLATQAVMNFTASLVRSGQAAITSGAEVARLSEKYGIAAGTISTLRYAADVSDTSLPELASGLDKLGKNAVLAAKGTGDAALAFRVLGVDVKDVTGSMKSQEQLLYEVADRIAAIEDTSVKAALAQRIFGMAGADLIPFLNNGADGLRRLQEEGRKWAEISGINAAEAKRLKDQQVELDYASQALGKTLASALVPWLNAVARAYLDARRNGDTFLATLSSIKSAAMTGGEPAWAKGVVDQETAKQAGWQKQLDGGIVSPLQRRMIEQQLAASQQRQREAQALLTVNDPKFLNPGGAEKPRDTNAAGRLAYAQLASKYQTKDQRLADELAAAEKAAAEAGETNSPGYQNIVDEIRRRYTERAPAAGGGSVKQDPYDTYLRGLQGEGAKAGFELEQFQQLGERANSTKAALVEFEVTRGRFADRSEEQKNALRQEAQAYDDLKDSLATTKEAWKYYEQSERQAAAASARSIEQTQQWRQQLQDQTGQSRINTIQDPAARAEAMLAKEKAVWQKRIALADEASGARQLIENDYQEWLVAKQDEMAEQMKPAWQRMVDSWADTTRLMKDHWERTVGGALRAGEDAFVKWAETGKLSIGDVFNTLRAEMARTVYRQAIGALGGGGSSGGGGGLGGLLGNLFGGGNSGPEQLGGPVDEQSGGIINNLGGWFSSLFSHTGSGPGDAMPHRMMPASLWNNAPRFHSGIGPNERPAIITRDESVLTPGQMRQLAPAGAAAPIIQIFEAPGTKARVQSEKGPNGQQLIKIIVDQVTEEVAGQFAGGGPVAAAAEGAYGLRRQAA